MRWNVLVAKGLSKRSICVYMHGWICAYLVLAIHLLGRNSLVYRYIDSCVCVFPYTLYFFFSNNILDATLLMRERAICV